MADREEPRTDHQRRDGVAAELGGALITGELYRRPSREPDHEAENRALAALARVMAESPRDLLQRLAEAARELCRAASAGVSILEEGGGVFRRHAIAGRFGPNLYGALPREASPCGVAIERDRPLLFDRPARAFKDLAGAEPPVFENLLVPFHSEGRPVGTLWVIAHTPERKFDAEDARLLGSLAGFASAAYQVNRALDAAHQGRGETERRVRDRSVELNDDGEALRREGEARRGGWERLRESEEQFRRAVEDAPIPVIMHAEDGEVLHVSRTWTELTGYTREDVPTFDAWLTRAYGAGADAVREHMRGLFKGNQRVLNVEFPVRTRGGDLRHWSFSASPLGILRDGRRFIVGMAADVTERERAEEALRESEARYRSLSELSPDSILVNAGGRFVYANRAAARLFAGGDAGEVVGRSPFEFIEPEYHDLARERIRQALEDGLTSQPLTYGWRRLDGSPVDVEVVAAPVTWEGRPAVQVVLRDVTERKQAEDALRESEERLRKAVSIETVGVIFFDPERVIRDANNAFVRMSGYPREAFAGGAVRWDVLTPPEFMEASFRASEELLTRGESTPYEKQYVRPDGSRWWGLFAGKRLSETEFVEFVIDVTERRRVEGLLRESEERLRLLVESVHDYAIFTLDTEGRVTSWNEGAHRIKGYTAEQITGLPATVFYTEEDVAAGKPAAEMGKALAEGRTEDEGWRVRKGGSLFWANEVMTPLRSEDGTLIGFAKVCRDLTERRRAEELLRASEERLRLVVESVEDYAIFTMDAAGLIKSWNPGAERTFGYTAEEAVGQHTRIIFTPQDRERGVPEEEMRQAREQGRAEDERWHVSKRGARFYVSGINTALRDGGGRLIGYVKIARDQTERKELEEALRRAHDELEERVDERTRELQVMTGELLTEVKERGAAEARVKSLLGRLVAVQEEERLRIARDIHDQMGQQMSALRLSLSSLCARCEGHAELAERACRTQELAEELDQSIDFLTWELRPAALDHLGLSAALANLVRGWSERFHVPAEYHASGVDGLRLPPEAEINLYRLAQEALHNVYKHAGAQNVGVFFERRGTQAVLIVEDDGRGFDPEQAPRGGEGAGMGLVGMRERATLVGGEFEVESSAGGGTTIYVRVPLRQEVAGGGAGDE